MNIKSYKYHAILTTTSQQIVVVSGTSNPHCPHCPNYSFLSIYCICNRLRMLYIVPQNPPSRHSTCFDKKLFIYPNRHLFPERIFLHRIMLKIIYCCYFSVRINDPILPDTRHTVQKQFPVIIHLSASR